MKENPHSFLTKALIILGGVMMFFFIGFGKQFLFIGAGVCFVLAGLVGFFGGNKK